MRIIFVSFFLFFIQLDVKSQVVYTDIIPDSTISVADGFYNLDLNGDGIYDFMIVKRSNIYYSAINIKPLNDNSYVSYYQSVEYCLFAKAFNLNDSIGDFLDFTNIFWEIPIAFLGDNTCLSGGGFLGETNKCLGLKVIKNGITYFGWIRMDVPFFPLSCILKDYAYDSNTIYAGAIPRTWTGTVSDDWNEDGNWNPTGKPVFEDVHIVPGTNYMPVIRNYGMNCGSLFIEDGANVTILQGFLLTVHGNLILKN